MAKQDNNRMRVSLPVSGLDTSTPEETVADGKCEELHNLRWESGSWHNIDPLKIKHRLVANDDDRILFSKLSIVYHHPAAGDDVYIASYPNADGTINLLQYSLATGIIELESGLCPIYLYPRNSPHARPWRILSAVSLYEVASDITITVECTEGPRPISEASARIVSRTVSLTIKKNTKESAIENNAIPIFSTGIISPEEDSIYKYRLFANEEAARINVCAFATDLPADIKITHFGNILVVMDSKNRQVIHYYKSGGSYEEFQIPAPPIVRQSSIFSLNSFYPVSEGSAPCTKIAQYKANEINSGVPIFNISKKIFYISQVTADCFWGEICYFAAFQMADGSIISPSALSIAASEPSRAGLSGRTYFSFGISKFMYLYTLYVQEDGGEKILKLKTLAGSGDGGCTPFTFWICPYITLTIPKSINSRLITGVNIYSTRINPIWDAEKLKDLNVTLSLRFPERYRADNKLPEQPFYFVKSIPIDDFTDGQFSMYLGGDLLEDIEQNSTYEPVDAHSLYYDVAREYNSRIHIYGNTYLHLFAGYGSDFFPATFNVPTHEIITNLRVNETDYRVKASATQPLNSFTTFVYNKILSYPDYRATFMYAPSFEEIGTSPYKINLRSAQSNNIAYAVFENDSETYNNVEYCYVKYSVAIFKGMYPETQTIEATNALVPQPNKLRVSAPNTPFSFPLANSYAIGTENNRILAVNSAAIEMSDAKFGEFPLFVFTEEGIFTLQSGNGEVLYSAIIPLNYDRIINPETLAVNHNVLYVTARGIQAMFSNESRLISEPINDLHNTPPLDYLRTAKLCYQPAHNEVIVWNPTYAIGRAAAGTRAYVYSLDGGYWSTRDLEGVKLNTDELVVHTLDQIQILDLSEEEARSGQPVRVRLVTRPLKFGSTEFKRLETFVARLHTPAPQSLRLLFEGSSDLKTWITLRDSGFITADRDTLLRRFPCSMRFLRVTLEADLDAGFELAQFDAEYYTRFLHRLR